MMVVAKLPAPSRKFPRPRGMMARASGLPRPAPFFVAHLQASSIRFGMHAPRGARHFARALKNDGQLAARVAAVDAEFAQVKTPR
jgi:hypothetical protein